ncbi:peptidyl-alpha-hydroxyglycine alpha-amidating lyase family protein [Parasphingopyxis marina]|uniref:Uncharacterized protein n=1 Tax=Parasphingopyxis marina TaxID=2761622 RepID=A0A842I456_9SPHN|nr:peptidyl-alpha-hydroxyglycine alpha-amidating lyase family protein [Parasphingopyxis marina]MBC2778924.1 hypothetical protein [Parasphingopyxis marina]
MTLQFGDGEYRYELVEGWGRLPDDWSFMQVAGIAVDSQDRVYAFHRGMHPCIVFDREGNVLSGWGDGQLAEAHGLYIDRDDNVFFVDRGAHTIEKFSTEGEKLLTVGERWQCAPKFSNLPFNRPQGVATAPNGDIYVADGKCNNAIHWYNPQGEHIKSWGKEGTGPGEFNEPHGMWIKEDGTVMAVDRGNDRIQFFSPDGEYLYSWDGLSHPDHIYIGPDGTIYITEIDSHSVSIWNDAGELQTRWGGERTDKPGLFCGPHGIWADSHGDLYVSEVLTGRRVQKFRRL